MGEMRHRGGSRIPWVILAVVVIVLAVIAILFRDKLFSRQEAATGGKSSGYQAVFLTNGQVYFGKMSNARGEDVTLKDIFYLQVQNPPIQGSQQQQQAQAQQQQPQLSLVKLGNELHGPIDEMHINREHILFYEDMKEDAKVIQAIREYKANPQGVNNQGQQQDQRATPPPAQFQTPPANVTPPPASRTVTPPPAPSTQ